MTFEHEGTILIEAFNGHFLLNIARSLISSAGYTTSFYDVSNVQTNLLVIADPQQRLNRPYACQEGCASTFNECTN